MIKEIIKKMQTALKVKESALELAEEGIYNADIYKMVKTVENLTLSLSNECAVCGTSLQEDDENIMEKAGVLIDEKVEKILENNKIKIFLPVAVPGRNNDAKKYSYSYYRNLYYNLLSSVLREEKPYEEPINIWIIQVGPRKTIRDYDDIEPKMLIDVLAAFILRDDSPEYYDLHYSYEINEQIGTQIIIEAKNVYKNE